MTATVAVVGGGIAGAAAAWGLRDADADVTLFEATDALGGRMATRERDGCRYDYAANFLKGDDERVRSALRAAVGDELVTVEGDVRVFDADRRISAGRTGQAPKFTTRRGVQGIVAAFARESGATVALDARVGHVARRADGWALSTAGGREVRADALVLALPASDAAGLLADADWGHQLCPRLVAAIEGVPHRPVDSVVCHYPFRTEHPFYGLVATGEDHDVGWLSREECKPGHVPDGESLLVVQSSPRWTATHPDADAETAGALAREAAADLLDDERRRDPDWTDHARWAAAVPDGGVDPALVERAVEDDLGLAGDWVAGVGRTYAALRTGLDAAANLERRLGD
ncbi:MAG: NAD(P)/FAD-dependent oxidoreductase [Halorientalis sp.]